MYVSFAPVKGQANYGDPNGSLRELVIDPNCKTIQLYREGWPLSYPVINLHEDIPLVLEFDDLSTEQPTYMYKVYHCNADWTLSDLNEQEYLEGFPENELPGGEPSFNTYYNYLHYTLQIPNQSTRLLLSGNYLLVVYKNRDMEDVVFTRRFMVTENQVNIEAKAARSGISRCRVERPVASPVTVTGRLTWTAAKQKVLSPSARG
jgi:hypothetical protein